MTKALISLCLMHRLVCTCVVPKPGGQVLCHQGPNSKGQHQLAFCIMYEKNLPCISLDQYSDSLTGLQIFFQDWWAEVTHGAKKGGTYSEMMGPSISN